MHMRGGGDVLQAHKTRGLLTRPVAHSEIRQDAANTLHAKYKKGKGQHTMLEGLH